jgi:hypothetical protein
VLPTSTVAFALTTSLPLVRRSIFEPEPKGRQRATAEQSTSAAKMILTCVLRSALSNECDITQNPINARATKAAAQRGTQSAAKAIIFKLIFSIDYPSFEMPQP